MTAPPPAQPSKRSGGAASNGSLFDVLSNGAGLRRKQPRLERGSRLTVAPPARGPDPLLTADDVAAVLGVPQSFVYALARRGEIPTVRIGDRYVRFRTSALEAWIEARETTERRGTQ